MGLAELPLDPLSVPDEITGLVGLGGLPADCQDVTAGLGGLSADCLSETDENPDLVGLMVFADGLGVTDENSDLADYL